MRFTRRSPPLLEDLPVPLKLAFLGRLHFRMKWPVIPQFRQFSFLALHAIRCSL